ncbi:IS110 family transposase [Mycolicibacterium frederiksbergense]|uniref:IS110 family transposase n=1 Tax=Mycolicibacterium frederiksbergense TaxID=117567 RepID=UPI00399A04F3
MSTVKLFCGIDWAEAHHDIAIVDGDGTLMAKKRITDDPGGFAELIELLAEAGDCADAQIPVAIETPRGLLVAALRATGRPVYAINPLAVARYRERHSVARTKSDHADAMTLANILRVDAHLHRKMPDDTELCQAIAVLARGQQDAIWRRTKASNELRSFLREYYPTFLAAFRGRFQIGIASPEARAVLAIAPTPAAAVKLSVSRTAAALRRAGRQRGVDQVAAEIKAALRAPQLRQLPLVETAMGRQTLALLAALDAACHSVVELGQASGELFQIHPDYQIITSFPGLADSAGARVLAEIGDDRTRFTDARALKAYAGTAPITRASGRSISITRRRIKNDRLAAASWVWGFAAMGNHPGAQAHYRRRREQGDHHAAAIRHLVNKFLGQLHHCLQNRQTFDDAKAFASPPEGVAA